MKRPLQIGITGGIGSGKSLVCRIFHTLGVPVYDADSRAKAVMTTDGILVSHIKKEFGVLSYRVDGSLDREYLAQAVFNNTERLKILNNLVHPRVARDFEQWVSGQKGDYILKEAALLFETKSHTALDKIIVVFAPEQLRIKRVLKRDTQRTEQQIREIIHHQIQDEEKLQRADFVIMNDETQLVIPQVLELHRSFLEIAGSR